MIYAPVRQWRVPELPGALVPVGIGLLALDLLYPLIDPRIRYRRA